MRLTCHFTRAALVVVVGFAGVLALAAPNGLADGFAGSGTELLPEFTLAQPAVVDVVGSVLGMTNRDVPRSDSTAVVTDGETLAPGTYRLFVDAAPGQRWKVLLMPPVSQTVLLLGRASVSGGQPLLVQSFELDRGYREAVWRLSAAAVWSVTVRTPTGGTVASFEQDAPSAAGEFAWLSSTDALPSGVSASGVYLVTVEFSVPGEPQLWARAFWIARVR